MKLSLLTSDPLSLGCRSVFFPSTIIGKITKDGDIWVVHELVEPSPKNNYYRSIQRWTTLERAILEADKLFCIRQAIPKD